MTNDSNPKTRTMQVAVAGTVAALGLILCVITISLGFSDIKRTSLLQTQSKWTTGIVQRIWFARARTPHYAVVNYTYSISGTPYQGTSTEKESDGALEREGAPVGVQYFAGDPTVSRTARSIEMHNGSTLLLMGFVLLIPFGAMAAFTAYMFTPKGRKHMAEAASRPNKYELPI